MATKTIDSSKFSITINRSSTSDIQLGINGKTSEVRVYRGADELTPVSGTPGANQFKISLVCNGCEADIKSDNRTIYVTSVSQDSATITVSINVENNKTFNKNITVEKVIDAGEIESVKSSISSVSQTADKISWLVATGSDKSTMTLTSELYDLVSNNISLTADRINLNGYVTNEDSNWSIGTDGNMVTKNLAVEGELSVDSIVCNKIINPNYLESISGDLNLYVNSTTGSDDADMEDEAVFATLDGLVDKLPKNLGSGTIRIYLQNNDDGQVIFRNFVSGRIMLFLCSYTVNGYLGFYNCYCDCKIYGGDTQSAPTTKGIIKPSTNTIYTSGSDNMSIYVQKCPVFAIYYTQIYGGSSDSSYSCIRISENCNARVDNCDFYSADTFVNVSSVCNVYVANSTGTANSYGFRSYTGSVITLSGSSQAGGKTAAYLESNGSVILGSISKMISGATSGSFNNTGDVGSNTSTTVAKTTKTVTYTSNYGDTYRSSVYNSWKKDGTCRQGEWGYGNCNGCWFFGTQISNLKGKTINKVTITIKRQSGGQYAAVNLLLKMHNHSSRPSGAPSYLSSWSKTVSLAVNSSTTVTITDTAVLNAIQNGTMKGFGLQASYSNSTYAVCSGSATVKITYTE